MTENSIYDAIIIGGGISGLATAFHLHRNGQRVLVLEKDDRIGGSIRTEIVDGFMVEHGPNSTLDTSPRIHELFAALGIKDQMEYANDRSKNRYIVRHGQLHALPMNPIKFMLTPLFSLTAKLRLFREPFISASPPDANESLAEFVMRRLGKEFLDYAINPFVAGVYAGTPEQLSVKAGFPKLYALEQEYGSLIKGGIMGARKRKKLAAAGETSKQSAKLFSFRNGMQTVIDALGDQLAGQIQMGAHVKRISPTEYGHTISVVHHQNEIIFPTRNIVFAIPVHAFREIKFDLDFPLQASFDRIHYPPVTMVFFGYHDHPACRPLDGFGFLIPQKENKQILGTIWSSIIFNNRAPRGGVALTTFVGGSRQPQHALLPEDELVELVTKDLHDLMGIDRPPDIIVTRPWPQAIPQYNLDHPDILKEVDNFELKHPGLYFSGNFRGGISVGDCIKRAQEVAEKVGCIPSE